MDADMSHPPEKIPEMVKCLENEDFVLGSRYVSGASTDDKWGFFRRINSWIATLLARPFTDVRDPMSGFFALRRETLDQAQPLNPVGYKIGLELIVKCGCEKVKEIPIHFAKRQFGKSKLNFREQMRYIRHIRRLFMFKYGTLSQFTQFIVVGCSGVIVNLGSLTLLLRISIPASLAVAIAIAISMFSNFLLNRRFTFSHARHDSFWKQLTGFVGACSIGAIINYLITLLILNGFPDLIPQTAALFGIAAGTGTNFLINRYYVFKEKE
jgi:dolichol-phosphate mannosyltransferase